MRILVDILWYPKDGWEHCHDAYHSDVGDKHRAPNKIAMVILFILFTQPVSIIVFIFQGIGFIMRGFSVPNKIITHTNITLKSFQKLGTINESLLTQIDEHEWDLDINQKKEIWKRLKQRKLELEKIEEHLKDQKWVNV
jgi:cell shape-determining protein MreC